jgi:AcrR family transcriptional regulator
MSAAASSSPPAALPTPETAPRQRRKQARPQELLDAALLLFAEKGFAATRTDEVAQRAGVSKGTLYLYYPSKEDLFKAVVRKSLVSVIDEGREALARYEGSSADLLRAMLLTWWQRVGMTPTASVHKIIVSEARNFPELAQFYTDEVIAPADALFCAALQRGIDRGEFRALPLHATAHALIAPLIFMTLHQHSVGACALRECSTLTPEDMLETHLELVLHGLEVRELPKGPKPPPQPLRSAAQPSKAARPARALAKPTQLTQASQPTVPAKAKPTPGAGR